MPFLFCLDRKFKCGRMQSTELGVVEMLQVFAPGFEKHEPALGTGREQIKKLEQGIAF